MSLRNHFVKVTIFVFSAEEDWKMQEEGEAIRDAEEHNPNYFKWVWIIVANKTSCHFKLVLLFFCRFIFCLRSGPCLGHSYNHTHTVPCRPLLHSHTHCPVLVTLSLTHTLSCLGHSYPHTHSILCRSLLPSHALSHVGHSSLTHSALCRLVIFWRTLTIAGGIPMRWTG